MHTVPRSVISRVAQLSGDPAKGVEQGFANKPVVSIRYAGKVGLPAMHDPVEWCSRGCYLSDRPQFTLDPLFHAGVYYVQEASSMLVEQAVRAAADPGRDILALDLCAAPGGKSTHLADLLSTGSLVVCNETVGKRNSILQENVWKCGAANTMITMDDARTFAGLGPTFDLILLDAPCSGEGMMRKDPFAREQWSDALVSECAYLQRELLDQAWAALNPGGHLIYSTCTFESVENEGLLDEFLMRNSAQVCEIPVDPNWGVVLVPVGDGSGLYMLPHRVRGEGFFLAMLKKPGAHSTRSAPNDPEHPTPVDGYIDRSMHAMLAWDRVHFAVPRGMVATANGMRSAVRTISPGVPVSVRKGDHLLPHPALALSSILNYAAFEQVELERQQALELLRGATLPASGARGMALATYEGHGLLWLKGAGARWNNHWPRPWRIKHL